MYMIIDEQPNKQSSNPVLVKVREAREPGGGMVLRSLKSRMKFTKMEQRQVGDAGNGLVPQQTING